jgi:hypothetical protein
MKEKKGIPGGMFLIAGLLFFFNACNTPLGEYWEYTFDNQTQYSIDVSLNKGYRLSKEGVDQDGILQVAGKSNKKIFIKAGSVDFWWVSSSQNNNRYIYPITSGSTVTFKERAK